MNQTFGWEALGAGLIFLATSTTSLLEPYFGHLSDKYGTRYFAVAAFALSVPPYLLLRLVEYDSRGQKILLVILLSLIGTCWSLGMTPLTAEISKILDEFERTRPGIFGARGASAQAFGLTNVAFAAGSMVGPIWGGYMKDAIGWGNMTSSIALLSAVTVIPLVSSPKLTNITY